jgi:hypothetical protein
LCVFTKPPLSLFVTKLFIRELIQSRQPRLAQRTARN